LRPRDRLNRPPVISCGANSSDAEGCAMTMRWKPPVGLSRQEKLIMKLHKRTRKLFAFVRLHRHEIVDDDLERKLEEAYRRRKGCETTGYDGGRAHFAGV